MHTVRTSISLPEVEEAEVRDIVVSQQLPRPDFWARNLQYCCLLWEKRRILYKAAALALMSSVAIAFLLRKSYESTTSIMPPGSLGNNNLILTTLAGKTSPELAGMAASALGIKSTSELFVGLLRSRLVEEEIVDRFHLQQIYGTRYKQDACKVLERRTRISEDRKTGIITISVNDRQPQRARDITEAFIDGLNRLLSQVSTSSARRERLFIEQRLSRVKADLEDAEQQFSTFASQKAALDIKEQTRAMVDSAASLQGRLIAAESEVEGLRQIYSPNNVRMRAAQAQVNELKQELAKIGGTDAALPAAAPPDQIYPPIRKLPLLGVQWADLYRRVKIQETIYELLNQQYELARIEEAKEIPSLNVIDPANLPETKAWPPRIWIILGLTTLAMAAVIGNILATERIQSLRESDPRRQLAMAGLRKWQACKSHLFL